MKRDPTQLSALSRLFSSTILKELATRGKSALFRRLVDISELSTHSCPQHTIADAFDTAFKLLNHSGLRDEYIYRAFLIRRVLLGTHSLHTASMLSEFRVGNCRTDLVILNGSATAYEIKSERDSLARLVNQVTTYQRAFAKTYVVTSEDQANDVLSVVPESVGVMRLTQRRHVSTIREARECYDHFCPTTVFDSLRTTEVATILEHFDIQIPNVPNTRLRTSMRDAFADLEPKRLQLAMVQTLKRTRNLAPMNSLIEQIPNSLHAVALSTQIRRKDHDRLAEVLTLPLAATKTWN